MDRVISTLIAAGDSGVKSITAKMDENIPLPDEVNDAVEVARNQGHRRIRAEKIELGRSNMAGGLLEVARLLTTQAILSTSVAWARFAFAKPKVVESVALIEGHIDSISSGMVAKYAQAERLPQIIELITPIVKAIDSWEFKGMSWIQVESDPQG